MSNYYFLVASLPLLAYEEREASEPAEFLTMLAEHLTTGDLAAVAAARIDAPLGEESWSKEAVAPDVLGTAYARPANPIISGWEAFERGLRNALVHMRSSARNADPYEHIRLDAAGHEDSDRLEIDEAAHEAFNNDSPLSGEEVLNRARWSFLDDMEVGHYFDLERIIIYYLKLQILARRRLFTRAEGEERFAQIQETIINDYYQEQSE